MNPILPNPINLGLIYEDDESYLTARQASRGQGVLNAQMPVALAAGGFGVRPDIDDEMLVTTATGLNVTVGTGITIVGVDGENMACGIQLSQSFVRGPLPANRDSLNPIYLFAAFDEGDPTLTDLDDENSITRPDSFESRQGIYPIGSTPTVEGQVLLATITTNGSSVTSITPNPNRFIQTSGTGVPDGGETDEVLTKTAPDDGAATWKPAAKGIPTQYHLAYTGSSSITLTGPAGSATMTPGDGQVATKNRLVTATGAEFADITLTGFTSDAGTGGTGNLATGGTASANGYAGDSRSAPAGAFDGETTGDDGGFYPFWWMNGLPTTPAWIQYDRGLDNEAPATSITIWPRTGMGGPTPYANLAPRDFVFAGSNDGSTWTPLTTQSAVSGWTGGTSKTFSFSNTTSYRYYRLTVTATLEGANVMIAELQIMGLTNPGTIEFDASFADGKNYDLSVSNGTLERTQDGNIADVAMSYESGVELRSQTDGLALRVAELEDTPVQRGSLNTITGINAPTTLDALDGTYAVDTTSGNIVQPIPVVSGRSGQQLRFTKDTNGSNTVTLDFDGGEDDIVLMAEGDTVTIQAYSTKWRIVGKYPPGDMTG